MDDVILNWYYKKKKEKKHFFDETDLTESIIDFEKKYLSKQVWVKNKKEFKMNPELRKFVLSTFDKMFDKLNINKNDVVTIYLIGSITGYYYNKFTDVDVQAVVKFKTEEEYEKKLEDMKKFFEYGYLKFKDDFTHPINFYIRMYEGENKIYPPTIDGIYDLVKDKWIKKQSIKIEIDKMILDTAISWARKVESDLSELKRDYIEYVFYENVENEEISLNTTSLSTLKKNKLKEILYDLDNIKNTMSVLREWRTECQQTIVENYNYSDFTQKKKVVVNIDNVDDFMGIVVWKLLDRYGYISKMGNLKYFFTLNLENEITLKELLKQIKKELVPEELFSH